MDIEKATKVVQQRVCENGFRHEKIECSVCLSRKEGIRVVQERLRFDREGNAANHRLTGTESRRTIFIPQTDERKRRKDTHHNDS